MDNDSYLLRLAIRLSEGLARLPEDLQARQAAYLRTAQNADGGFSGREGGSDLYYTGFALRGLAVLDALTPEVGERAAGYLRRCLTQRASVIDFYSLLYACFILQTAGLAVLADSPPDWPERVAAALETFRTPDGGYAKAAGHASGSVYHSFLVGLCYEILGRRLPQPESMRRFIQSRRRDDGGYVEIAPMRRSGTNPTAAAVGLLQLLGDPVGGPPALTAEVRSEVSAFVAAMVSPEGGLRGNGRAPVADLLSTFTGLWTLDQLGALDRLEPRAALRFVQALESPTGGFRGGLWDEHTDVEYTFYGLGCLALLPLAAQKGNEQPRTGT
jgi:geranylgeranyl transferase type-2 subunit beta